MRIRRRLATVAAAVAVLSCLSLLPGTGTAEPHYKGPPLSFTALLSRFAREQGLAPIQLTESALSFARADEASLQAASAPPQATGSSEIRVNQDWSLFPQNETTVAVNPWSPNMIVAGANDYRLGSPIGAAFYTSFTGGTSWTDGIPPLPLLAAYTGANQRLIETPFGTGDPVVAFGQARPGTAGLLPGTATVYYAYLGVSARFCEHGIFVSRSTNGLTWTRPVVPPLFPPGGLFTPVYWDRPENCSVFNDKPWMAVDRSGGPHNGRVYVVWTRFRFAHQRFESSTILLSYSDDNALTWSPPIEVSGPSAGLCPAQVSGPAGRCDENQFSTADVGADGTLYVGFLNQQSRGLRDGFRNQYLVVSVDPDTLAVSEPRRAASMVDGKFDLPVNALGQPTLCNANFRLNTAGNLVVDPSDATGKTLYLVFVDNRHGSRFESPPRVSQDPPDSFLCPEGTGTDTDIYITRSTDGGLTWSSPDGAGAALRVNQDPLRNGRDQWFPFAAVTPDGRVDVVFYDRRDDPFNRLARVYLARSWDGGATWTETRVSGAASNMNWAFEDGLFIGDYNGVAVSPDGVSYPFWTDARNATSRVRQSDVFMGLVRP